jgi:(1->4)-alpha-D-glucan 1-alpha-D-glucosylmutase
MINTPASTYRVQLNSEFRLADLERISGYLHELGVTTIYASPLFKALPGSTHGYDVTDPCIISPEIGTLEELKTISSRFQSMGMTWLQDIVPNHMAFSTANNWIHDVLERGKHSEFYEYFDILENHPIPEYSEKLMVPFLGSELEDSVANNEISLCLDTAKGFIIQTPGESYPVSVSSCQVIYDALSEQGVWLEELQELAAAGIEKDQASWKDRKARFLENNRYRFQEILTAIDRINENKDCLLKICHSQYYILTNWRKTHTVINYRRFFTVNVLICLAMEKEKTFDDYHRFILRLYKDGIIHGLRIDHIDGLKNPGRYLQRVRELFGKDCFVIIEKILSGSEVVSPLWDIQGTSGYEFLSFTSQLLTDEKGATELREFYHNLVHAPLSFRENMFNSKMFILKNHMHGELDNLINYFMELELSPPDSDRHRLSEALAIFMCSLPVYRIYPERYPLEKEEMHLIDATYGACLQQSNNLSEEFRLLYTVFHDNPDDAEKTEKQLRFIQRLMQFTGPLTAKGVEDTAFYNYNPLISHNEVGDSPAVLGESVEAFHDKMLFRQKKHPHSLNASSTHDTKRGEDSRVRINLLSEFVEEWTTIFREWHEKNQGFKTKTGSKDAPSLNDEYFIYQSLVGAFPASLQIDEAFIRRVKEYMMKAVRESKFNSSWDDPDNDYENACYAFIDQILDWNNEFLGSFVPFLQKILGYAFVYSLVQALLKLTAPGIPDIYQGSEIWDLSFVDPDNRSQVNYEERIRMMKVLKQLESEKPRELFDYLKEQRSTGIEKLFVISKTLELRKLKPQVFSEGEYYPVYPARERSSVVSFCRQYDDEWVLVVCPLQLAIRSNGDGLDMTKAYKNIDLILPAEAPKQWKNHFTGEEISIKENISIQKLLDRFPVGLFVGL